MDAIQNEILAVGDLFRTNVQILNIPEGSLGLVIDIQPDTEWYTTTMAVPKHVWLSKYVAINFSEVIRVDTEKDRLEWSLWVMKQ